MKSKRFLITTLILSATMVPMADAALSVTTDDFTYSQTFDSLATTGTGNVWANNSTIGGWYLYIGTGAAAASYNADTGTGTAGSFISYGSASNTDRALGALGSGGAYFGSPSTGSVAGYISVALTNNTGAALDGLAFSFDGEQWRNGGNTTAHTMVMEYGFGAAFASVSTWTAPGGNFNWTTPVAVSTAAAVVGNTTGLVAARGGTLGGINWLDGTTLWIRWIDRNDAGNDHGMAIDNFSITAVPEPAAALLGGIGLLGLLRRRRV